MSLGDARWYRRGHGVAADLQPERRALGQVVGQLEGVVGPWFAGLDDLLPGAGGYPADHWVAIESVGLLGGGDVAGLGCLGALNTLSNAGWLCYSLGLLAICDLRNRHPNRGSNFFQIGKRRLASAGLVVADP
ncbi:hypothetical protein D9M71_609230 [compost metagenome]